MHKFVIFDIGGVGLTSYLPKKQTTNKQNVACQKTWLAFYAGSLVFLYDQVFAHKVQVCAIGHNPPVGRLETRKKTKSMKRIKKHCGYCKNDALESPKIMPN